MERDQQMQQENISAQAEANARQQQAAAQTEIQKQQAITQSNIQLEKAKAQMESQKLMQEADLKKQLMQLEFQFNMQLKNSEVEAVKGRDQVKEDRKDERTKIQATQQSELIEQRTKNSPPRNFESAGNDVLGGNMGLAAFGPR